MGQPNFLKQALSLWLQIRKPQDLKKSCFPSNSKFNFTKLFHKSSNSVVKFLQNPHNSVCLARNLIVEVEEEEIFNLRKRIWAPDSGGILVKVKA